MPLYVPKNLPAEAELRSQGAAVCDEIPEGVRPLRVLLLNLMPLKAVTELDISRQLAKAGLHVQLIPMKIRGQSYKNTPQEHMDAFYRDFDELASRRHDGLIVTGAPVERMPFGEVRYWKQLTEIFEWSRTEVRSALYLCWGAQAGLYHFYGIPKRDLPRKLFGVYEQRQLRCGLPVFRGVEKVFNMPHSRYTEVRREDVGRVAGLEILAEGPRSGVGVVKPADRSEFYVLGHLEYAPGTLGWEYSRDISKGVEISPPENYYKDGRPERGIDYSWRKPADLFYSNWLRYYVSENP